MAPPNLSPKPNAETAPRRHAGAGHTCVPGTRHPEGRVGRGSDGEAERRKQRHRTGVARIGHGFETLELHLLEERSDETREGFARETEPLVSPCQREPEGGRSAIRADKEPEVSDELSAPRDRDLLPPARATERGFRVRADQGKRVVARDSVPVLVPRDLRIVAVSDERVEILVPERPEDEPLRQDRQAHAPIIPHAAAAPRRRADRPTDGRWHRAARRPRSARR